MYNVRFLVLAFAALITIIGCSDDDNNSGKCRCDAQYSMCEGEVQTFPDTEIDCDTGEILGLPTADPCAIFIGCLN